MQLCAPGRAVSVHEERNAIRLGPLVSVLDPEDEEILKSEPAFGRSFEQRALRRCNLSDDVARRMDDMLTIVGRVAAAAVDPLVERRQVL